MATVPATVKCEEIDFREQLILERARKLLAERPPPRTERLVGDELTDLSHDTWRSRSGLAASTHRPLDGAVLHRRLTAAKGAGR